VLAVPARDAARVRFGAGFAEGSTPNAPSMSSYMSMSGTAVRLAAVRLAALLVDRSIRLGAVSSSDCPLVCGVGRFASLPEALVTVLLTGGVDTVRFGVSSFLRFEERGESSMAAIVRLSVTESRFDVF
jgi:hypothetical protein